MSFLSPIHDPTNCLRVVRVLKRDGRLIGQLFGCETVAYTLLS